MVGGRLLPPVDRCPKMAGGRFELEMEPTAIGLVSLNSNSETHMTAICDARLIYGRGVFHGYLYAVQLYERYVFQIKHQVPDMFVSLNSD